MDAGVATVVERSLRALTVGPSDQASAGACTTTLPRTLSWGAVRLGEESVLPTAEVTWPGHARVMPVRVTTAGPADVAAAAAAATAETVGAGGVDPFPRRGVDASAAGAPATGSVHPSGARAVPDLNELPVGGGLVDVLAGVEVADTSDADLLDVAARWQDVISWATAMQSRALGEIGRRRAWTEEHNAAAAEISARLRVPQGEANKHLARGAGLAEHPQVLDALHQGLIDVAKADILLRSGNPLTTEERAEAIALYLPQAPDHTRRWLRDKMNEFATDLKGTNETTRHARSRRAVFLDPADNAMAWLSANLPATDAAAVWDAVEQAAHTLRRAPGGTRTLAQARADALVAITTGRLIVPPHPECTPEAGPTTTDSVGHHRVCDTESGAAGSVACRTGRACPAPDYRACDRMYMWWLHLRRNQHPGHPGQAPDPDHDPATTLLGPGQTPRSPGRVRGDPRRPRGPDRDGRDLATPAHRPCHRDPDRLLHHHLPTRQSPAPSRHRPGPDLRLPTVRPAPADGPTWTTSTPTTTTSIPRPSHQALRDRPAPESATPVPRPPSGQDSPRLDSLTRPRHRDHDLDRPTGHTYTRPHHLRPGRSATTPPASSRTPERASDNHPSIHPRQHRPQ